MTQPDTPSKSLPRITPNRKYAEDGHPVTRFDVYASSEALPSLAEALRQDAMGAKVLRRSGLLAVGDVS